jgi:uncharacterized protein YqeY
MSLKEQIQNAVKDAMRGGEKDKLSTLRMITAAIKQREVDERITLTDENVLQILDKMIKERRDAIEKFTAGNRQDLVTKETAEIAIIQTFMPAALSAEEITQLIKHAIKELNASGIKDMGKVMALLKPQLQGRADIGKVSAEIKTLL